MKKILVPFFLLVFFGCGRNEPESLISQFKKKSVLHVEKSINVDSLYITFPKIYNFTDTSLIFTSPAVGFSSEEYLAYIVSKKTGKIIKKLAAEGRGPNELQSIMTVSTFDDQVLFYDGMGSRIFYYNYMNDTSWTEKLDFKNKYLFRDLYKINNKYLAYGDFGNFKYCYGDLFEGSEKFFIEQPFLPDIPKSDQQKGYEFARASAYTGSLTNHPTELKFVLASRDPEYMQIIEIIGDSVKEIMHIITSPPVGKVVSQSGTNVWVSYRGHKMYFIDAVASPNYIYLLYSGNSYNGVDDAKGRFIMIFDWDGNKIEMLELDQDAYAITVDKNDTELTTLSINSETFNFEILYYSI